MNWFLQKNTIFVFRSNETQDQTQIRQIHDSEAHRIARSNENAAQCQLRKEKNRMAIQEFR